MTTINLSSSAAAEISADAIVIGITRGADGPQLAAGASAVDAAQDGTLVATLTALGATGKAGEVTKLASSAAVAAPVIVVVGLGEPGAGGSIDAEQLRRAAGAAARALTGSSHVVLALPTATVEELSAVAEGGLLGAYAYLRYRTQENGAKQQPVQTLTVVSALDDDAAREALNRADITSTSVKLVRDYVNASPSDLCPETFADAARQACAPYELDFEVLDESALAAGGYGGILGVGQGSIHPPRLVRIAYRHPEASRTIAFVGKGITFDSGGLSIKPADSMITMKSDMGGAAAVIAALIAIARLAPRINVVGYAPMAENMPSGTAQRPSDVLTIYGGKTVEVLNTDAEGRLVLADALVRAGEDQPSHIVDIATLTGACVVALGGRVSGIMSNDDALLSRVHDAAGRAGEQMWPLPLPEDLRKDLDSDIADIANIGQRWGGALAAGLFLKEFIADGVKWAHLDIAGPSFNDGEPYGYTPKGGTGAGVRTLVQLAEDAAADRL
ncbi:MAG: leucyl aminopeptidase [Sporichthyaceae bacterium]|nr:leucyl aminopeptidase [Sporichthyaceae bacterium]